MAVTSKPPVRIFSTCPASNVVERERYVEAVVAVARWSERYGCEGILIYTDNSLVDPWLVAQLVIQRTDRLCPLVAIQPVYQHPYTVAKVVASLGHLYRRRLHLNMVAGGFTNDLVALNDTTPHDRRYDRLVEYTTIITRLLSSAAPVEFEGEFYKVDKLRMTPPLAADLVPGIFVSGSSPAGVAAARALGAIAVKYPKAAAECEPPETDIEAGIRVGIIAREDRAEAWQIARQRFPEDRRGRLKHQLAMKVSDSSWHRELSQEAGSAGGSGCYWLVPFEMYKTFCPYLVGSCDEVADELGHYLAAGYHTFILDIPPCEEDLAYTEIVFRRAAASVGLNGRPASAHSPAGLRGEK